MNNASDTKVNNTDARQLYIPFNSLDFTAYVKRLPVNKSLTKDIYLYGNDNLYPQKIKEIAARSNSLQTALETFSSFTYGQGFEGLKDLIVNEDGLTGPQFFKIICNEKAAIGFAVHCSFNRFGEITEFTPVNFEFVRRKLKTKDDKWKKYLISNNWENTHFINRADQLEVFAFSPEKAIEQINEVGFENYPGQLFYWHYSNDIYGLATYDSVQDDAQFESDAKLYGLSNVQNGFSISGIFKYPANTNTLLKNDNLKLKFENSKGPINAGRIFGIPFAPNDNIPSGLWEPIIMPNVDTMFSNQLENAKRNIYEKYKQPSIINGRSDSGMFNAQSMQDAFDFYNSVTEASRQELESALNKLFEFSIFNVPEKIEIIPLIFISNTKNQNDGNGSNNIN